MKTAFPFDRHRVAPRDQDPDYLGLTKREYFTAAIASGMFADPALLPMSEFEYAARAVAIADAVLEELEKKK